MVQSIVSCKELSQKKRVNFDEVFSPVAKHSSIRIPLAMVYAFDLKLEQFDVKIIFLHDKLEEQIYIS